MVMDPVTERLLQHAFDKLLTIEDLELARTTEYDSTVIRVMKGCLDNQPNDLCDDVIQAHQYDLGARKGQNVAEFAVILMLLAIASIMLAMAWGCITAQPAYQDAVNNLAVYAGQAEKIEGNEHMLKHVEAPEIVESCNKNGPYQTWKDRYDKNKYYYMCQIREGKAYGIIVLMVNTGNIAMKTAFAPGDATFNEVRDYLTNTATRFNGNLR
jgi:hypothetical protein